MTITLRNPSRQSRALGAAAVLGGLSCAALGPATAEDSGFWEIVRAQNVAVQVVAPASAPAYYPSALREAPRPQIISLPSAPRVMKPATPPDPSKRDNPLVGILRDPTLRYGDVVVFPDGPRVFRGEGGGRHSPQDFVSVKAAKDMAPAARKTLLAMPIGENNAWSADLSARSAQVARSGKVARALVDVETTGSVAPALGKTVTVRTGRGEVRVIRVPD